MKSNVLKRAANEKQEEQNLRSPQIWPKISSVHPVTRKYNGENCASIQVCHTFKCHRYNKGNDHGGEAFIENIQKTSGLQSISRFKNIDIYLHGLTTEKILFYMAISIHMIFEGMYNTEIF